jgi:hypothetical protein
VSEECYGVSLALVAHLELHREPRQTRATVMHDPAEIGLDTLLEGGQPGFVHGGGSGSLSVPYAAVAANRSRMSAQPVT